MSASCAGGCGLVLTGQTEDALRELATTLGWAITLDHDTSQSQWCAELRDELFPSRVISWRGCGATRADAIAHVLEQALLQVPDGGYRTEIAPLSNEH